MALRYICVIAVLVGSALASTMELSGVVGRAACVGAECAPAPPVSGKKEEIWHCDGTCTNVYLRCYHDRFEVSFEPPAGARQTHAFALGGPGEDVNSQIEGCDSGVWGPGGRRPSGPDGRQDGPFGSPIHEVISYDRCGTTSSPSSDPANPHCREYHNSVNLLEYLPALAASSKNPVVHIVSNTVFNLKCCNCGGTANATCPSTGGPNDGQPAIAVLSDCTEKSFELTCTSDVESERYCCTLKAKDALPSGIGFHPKKCYGVDVDGTKAEVELLAPESNHLQVTLSGSSTTGFSFGGPWFQFDRAPRDAIDPHRVEIRCEVGLGEIDEIPSYSAGESCAAPSRPRSNAGFFQAGQLTLVK